MVRKRKHEKWIRSISALLAMAVMAGSLNMSAYASASASENETVTVVADDDAVALTAENEIDTVSMVQTEWKFDFGASNSPVQEGWTQITKDDDYSSEVGYGWLSNPDNEWVEKSTDVELPAEYSGMINLACDRVRAVNWEFAVDLQNATYEVTVYGGYPGAKPKLYYTIEGEASNISGNTSFVSITKQISVKDGQLNISGNGKDNVEIRGLVITKLAEEDTTTELAAPRNLKVEKRNVVGSTAQISISFDAVEAAASYNIYRSAGDGEAVFLVNVTIPAYEDSVTTGTKYSYYVKTVGNDGKESEASGVVELDLTDVEESPGESPEVNPSQTEWKFDFGSLDSPVQEGWTKISTGDDYLYSSGAKYGWITAPNQTYQYKETELTGELSDLKAVACDRVRGTEKAYEFAVDVPAGEYEVVVYTGHSEAGPYKFPCTIEDTEMELQEVSEFTAVKYEVAVSDGTLNLVVDERSAAAARVMQGLVITLKKAAEPDNPEMPDVSVAEIIEGEEPTVYYKQSFDDESALSSGLPVGWATAGKISSSAESGERIIKTEGEQSYYYLDTKGSDPKYIGKVLTGLSKTGWIEYDFNFIETTSEKYGLGLSCYPSSVNSGNIAIRGTLFPNGDVYFYNGSTNTKIANIKDAGWVHFVYEFNNNKKIYTVKITDAKTGKVIGKTGEAFSYNNEKGQVGAFSFSANGASKFGLDEIKVYGYPTPFEFEPEIGPLAQEGKVVLEENDNEFILKNDYCKVVIDKKKAVIKKFYTKEGNEILGSSGDGSYLLNYTDSGHIGTSKQEMTLKNCTGRIVRQTDDLCEVSVKEVRLQKGDKEGNVLPIDLEFRFLLKKDSPGLYMYAILSENYSDEDIANGRNFNFGQSRYSIKFDYDRLPYSAIQGGEIDGQLVKMAGPGDFNLGINEATNSSGQLFDSTYVLNDGSIFTKYNNLSYQYCNIMVGAFSDQGGLSLITPSRDWAGGGYAKQDIDVHGGTGSTFLVSWHLETGHNGTKGVDVEEGYQKVYGPVMWYASTDESINSKEEAYADAYAQALKEIEQWPYSWMAKDAYTDTEDCVQEYAATTRGSLKGTFSVKNGTINTEITNDLTVTDDTGKNSIGWAVLSDERSEYWALDNDYYEFYAPIKKDGTFEIDNIIPGTYKLNINVNGVMDEYVQHNIVIGEKEVKDLGNIVWDDPIYGKTLWTIGIPDKTAEEYAYAYPCRYWGSHLLFNNLFPNGVDFKIGESKESKDWFFVQMASQTAGHKEHYDGAFYFDDVTKKVKYDASRATAMETDDSRWRGNELATYKIRFDSDTAYKEGTGTLLINVCGNRFGTIRATLNGENIIDTAARVTVNGGNMTDSKGNKVTNPADTSVVSLYTDGSVGRSGLVGINQLVKIEFDASLIQEGENVIVLTHDHPAYQEDNETSWEDSDYTIYAGNIYDAIRLDVDGNVSSDNGDKEDVDKEPAEPDKPATPEEPEKPSEDETEKSSEDATEKPGDKPDESETSSRPENAIENSVLDKINNGYKVVNEKVEVGKGSVVPTDFITAAINNGTKLVLEVTGTDGKTLAKYIIDGSKFSKAPDSDLKLDVKCGEKNEVTDKVKEQLKVSDSSLFLCDFEHSGELNGELTITVYTQYDNGTELKVFYYNEATGKAEDMNQTIKVVEDGSATFTVNHFSSYILVKLADIKDDAAPSEQETTQPESSTSTETEPSQEENNQPQDGNYDSPATGIEISPAVYAVALVFVMIMLCTAAGVYLNRKKK